MQVGVRQIAFVSAVMSMFTRPVSGLNALPLSMLTTTLLVLLSFLIAGMLLPVVKDQIQRLVGEAFRVVQ
jgi:hypothetical protein